MRNVWIKNRKKGLLPLILTVGVLIAAVVLMVIYIGYQSRKSETVQTESLKENVNKTVTLCYSIEGRYPPTVGYMVEEYGLNYDEEKYYIHYEFIGSNLMPDFEVFMK